ncbi:MAG: glycoside hydrolase family 140 protein [Armatimonadaceae bacterium]
MSSVADLQVSENKRFLEYTDGTPFFYLGDTAWELFHRLNREEADLYLEDRAAKGYTVIQAVVLAELDGLNDPNPYGHTPLLNNDPTTPNEDYFAHVDYIVNKAESLGMFIGMLPTWGDKWNQKWGKGPVVFTPENAYQFGEWLAKRYADKPILWILGGDRTVETMKHVQIIRAMAAGLHAGDDGRHIKSFHPQGQQTSSLYFHCDEWLDFNMYQTGHSRDRDNWRSIGEEYRRTPIKPCLDAEPGYENILNHFRYGHARLKDHHCRKFLYWSLFAGACGHTYGCNDIWQMWSPGKDPQIGANLPWNEAIHLPGSGQMQHAKNLLLARPYFTRIPDQSVVVSDTLTGGDHIQATRDSEGAFVLVYTASGHPFTVNMTKLSGKARAAWFDPRTGESEPFGEFDPTGEQEFRPPSQGEADDWILTLDTL